MRRLALAFAVALPLLASAAQAQTLLVGNKGEDTVSFIDLKTGKERARVATAKWPHEIALSPDGEQAAVVAYGGASIDVFDVRSAKLVKRIDTSPYERPHGLLWLKTDTLLATTEGSETLTVVDMVSDIVTAIPTQQKGSHMVVSSPMGDQVYVANIGSGTVSVIDAVIGVQLGLIEVGGKPEGIALSRDGRELWVGDLSKPVVRVIETRSMQVVAEVPVDPVAIRVAISPDGKTVVTSNVGAGTITEIDRATRKVRRTIKVSGEEAAGQVTILYSADGSRLYVAETGRNVVAEVDTRTGEVLRRIPVGRNGDGLGIAP